MVTYFFWKFVTNINNTLQAKLQHRNDRINTMEKLEKWAALP
jgi:hypothetical protein